MIISSNLFHSNCFLKASLLFHLIFIAAIWSKSGSILTLQRKQRLIIIEFLDSRARTQMLTYWSQDWCSFHLFIPTSLLCWNKEGGRCACLHVGWKDKSRKVGGMAIIFWLCVAGPEPFMYGKTWNFKHLFLTSLSLIGPKDLTVSSSALTRYTPPSPHFSPRRKGFPPA